MSESLNDKNLSRRSFVSMAGAAAVGVGALADTRKARAQDFGEGGYEYDNGTGFDSVPVEDETTQFVDGLSGSLSKFDVDTTAEIPEQVKKIVDLMAQAYLVVFAQSRGVGHRTAAFDQEAMALAVEDAMMRYEKNSLAVRALRRMRQGISEAAIGQSFGDMPLPEEKVESEA